MKLVTVEQMKAMEAASDAAGHSYDAMMDRAGAAVAQVVQQRGAVKGKPPTASIGGKRVLVLVGSGNNGGDGLVAARLLREAGAEVACYLLMPRDDARVTAAREAGAFIGVLPDDRGLRVLRRFSLGADVVMDALFGTGARLPLPPDAHKLLNTVKGDIEARRNKDAGLTAPVSPAAPAGPLIVAVDGPSGMDFDSGALDVSALPADVSVTFAYPKIGHTRFPAADACGELIVADIGVDPALASGVALELADPHMIRRLLPARPASAHKGTFGKVMIVAGSIHYSGAPALAAAAAYRCGAGLVTVAAPRTVLPIVASRLTEATFQPLPDSMGIVSADAVPILSKALEGYRAVLIGPGLTHEKEAAAFLERLFGGEAPSNRRMGFSTKSDSTAPPTRVSLPPLVLDADGLNVVSGKEEWWKLLPESSVLTPHPGEMARLTRLERDEVEADRLGVASRFSQTWGHVVVLKGAFTVVSAPDGRIVVMPFATPALATAGSGDVLAGAIAGLRAQGLNAFDAALCGAYLHGLSGHNARTEIGKAGVVAGDLLERLPAAMRQLTGV
ncbi:MAG TPA: NAD(P)H-hydrate dehydratase [Anaerolineae bacterium]|nr:NAD(P)H-hydrate dehydratase [Anaerolineae bacterium]